MKSVLKVLMTGLIASFVLLSPLVFLPADSGLLVGLVLGFMGALLVILLFFMLAAVMGLYALLLGKWRWV